jgi:hypothetical protein
MTQKSHREEPHSTQSWPDDSHIVDRTPVPDTSTLRTTAREQPSPNASLKVQQYANIPRPTNYLESESSETVYPTSARTLAGNHDEPWSRAGYATADASGAATIAFTAADMAGSYVDQETRNESCEDASGYCSYRCNDNEAGCLPSCWADNDSVASDEDDESYCTIM